MYIHISLSIYVYTHIDVYVYTYIGVYMNIHYIYLFYYTLSMFDQLCKDSISEWVAKKAFRYFFRCSIL